MAKKDNSERDDLVHLLTETISAEGYDIDSDVEAEIQRLAKFVVANHHFEEDDEDEEVDPDEDNLFGEEDLFDEYEEEDEGLPEDEEL